MSWHYFCLLWLFISHVFGCHGNKWLPFSTLCLVFTTLLNCFQFLHKWWQFLLIWYFLISYLTTTYNWVPFCVSIGLIIISTLGFLKQFVKKLWDYLNSTFTTCLWITKSKAMQSLDFFWICNCEKSEINSSVHFWKKNTFECNISLTLCHCKGP